MAQNLYEAMFVVDAAKGGGQFPETIRHIAGVVGRHGGEFERIEKWDERKLAYPIRGVKRGIYILTYFRADGDTIAELRHTIQLSEEVLRVLVLRAEALGEVQGQLYSADGEQVAAEAPAAPVEPAAPQEEEPEQEADVEEEPEETEESDAGQ